MSIRPVKKPFTAKATLEGAGVHLRRAFGFGHTSDYDPFLLLDDFRNDVLRTTWPASPGIHIAASKRLPTCWPARSRTPTALATTAPSSIRKCRRAMAQGGCTAFSCGPIFQRRSR